MREMCAAPVRAAAGNETGGGMKMSDYRKAWDRATKEGDRHMRCRGGEAWNKDDFAAADHQLTVEWRAIAATMDDQMNGVGQSSGSETG